MFYACCIPKCQSVDYAVQRPCQWEGQHHGLGSSSGPSWHPPVCHEIHSTHDRDRHLHHSSILQSHLCPNQQDCKPCNNTWSAYGNWYRSSAIFLGHSLKIIMCALDESSATGKESFFSGDRIEIFNKIVSKPLWEIPTVFEFFAKFLILSLVSFVSQWVIFIKL